MQAGGWMADGGGTLDTDELGEAFDFMGVENWDVEGLMNIVENNGSGEVRCISTYSSQSVQRHHSAVSSASCFCLYQLRGKREKADVLHLQLHSLRSRPPSHQRV